MSQNERKKYVFGPVPSRRLGRSLGIDLVPFKTCTYDCVYCQLGANSNTCVERREYAPVDEVISQLRESLERESPDVITISGSGEPTLHAGLGEVIGAIKKISSTPISVLTNGSLLYLPEVREALKTADIVVPDLDAGSPEVFAKINRPHSSLEFEQMKEGLEKFGREYPGKLLLEVFLLPGINDNEAEVEKIAELAGRLKSRVQLNSVTRPPAENWALPLSRERLENLARLFTPQAEVIAVYKGRAGQPVSISVGKEAVLELLARRPCTIDDIAAGLNIHRDRVIQTLQALIFFDKIVRTRQGDEIYYEVMKEEP